MISKARRINKSAGFVPPISVSCDDDKGLRLLPNHEAELYFFDVNVLPSSFFSRLSVVQIA
jgi:hypothetical protein